MAKELTDKDRLAFAKQMEEFIEASHTRWRKAFLFSFLRGIATGLGVFLGGTIFVAILLWVLGGLGQVPFLHDTTENIRHTLEEGR